MFFRDMANLGLSVSGKLSMKFLNYEEKKRGGRETLPADCGTLTAQTDLKKKKKYKQLQQANLKGPYFELLNVYVRVTGMPNMKNDNLAGTSRADFVRLPTWQGEQITHHYRNTSHLFFFKSLS